MLRFSLESLLMRKYQIQKLCFMGLFFLMGCTAKPEYYSHSQTISLEGLVGYTNVFYEGDKLDKKISDIDSKSEEQNFNRQDYKLSRSWNDKELIIKKEGFKEYHLKLDSVLTSEPWASAEYAIDENKHYFPLLGLLVPVKTIKEVISVPVYLLLSGVSLITFSPISLTEYSTKTGIALISIPKAVALDIYDIISVPGTIIINPWTEFNYTPVVILEPTEQLVKYCTTQNDSFISNNGCTSCHDSNIVLYSSQRECSKCFNRQWENGRCQLR